MTSFSAAESRLEHELEERENRGHINQRRIIHTSVTKKEGGERQG
jgi:hypothetical protein